MLKIALIQLLVTSNKSVNVANACTKIRQAADKGAKLICLPECFNAPYGLKYFKEYSEMIPSGTTCQAISEIAKEKSVWIVGGSIPEEKDGKIYNSCVVYDPNGGFVGKYSKLHLFDIDVPGRIRFQESEVLTPGNQLFSFDVPVSNSKKITVGVGICYDVRFPDLAQIYTRHRNCNLLFYPGAFNMTTGPAHWEALGRGRAIDNQCFVCLCSTARDTSADYVSWGHTVAISPWGKVIESLDEKVGAKENVVLTLEGPKKQENEMKQLRQLI